MSSSTINQVLAGTLPPTPQLLEDIAPVLLIDLADLLVLAGMPEDYGPTDWNPYPSSPEITTLIAASTQLSTMQVSHLIERSEHFRSGNPVQPSAPVRKREKTVVRDFGVILHGLMRNRRLSTSALSRTTARAQSTINQLLIGNLTPTPQHLRDIAPTLQMDLADLLVLADLPLDSETIDRRPYRAAAEIGRLVALASFLTTHQNKELAETARALKVGQLKPT